MRTRMRIRIFLRADLRVVHLDRLVNVCSQVETRFVFDFVQTVGHEVLLQVEAGALLLLDRGCQLQITRWEVDLQSCGSSLISTKSAARVEDLNVRLR